MDIGNVLMNEFEAYQIVQCDNYYKNEAVDGNVKISVNLTIAVLLEFHEYVEVFIQLHKQ
jgi:hypothetical protein